MKLDLTPIKSDSQSISDYIKINEGLNIGDNKDYIYKDSKGKRTFGRGHLIEEGEDFSYVKDLSPSKRLEEVDRIFGEDVSKKISKSKDLFPQFDNYPLDLKQALVDGVFRGDHKSTHTTVKEINKSNWKDVPKNYIDRDDYRDSQASATSDKPWTGVYKRLDKNNKTFKKYAGSDRLIDKGMKNFMNPPKEKSSFNIISKAYASDKGSLDLQPIETPKLDLKPVGTYLENVADKTWYEKHVQPLLKKTFGKSKMDTYEQAERIRFHARKESKLYANKMVRNVAIEQFKETGKPIEETLIELMPQREGIANKVEDKLSLSIEDNWGDYVKEQFGYVTREKGNEMMATIMLGAAGASTAIANPLGFAKTIGKFLLIKEGINQTLYRGIHSARTKRGLKDYKGRGISDVLPRDVSEMTKTIAEIGEFITIAGMMKAPKMIKGKYTKLQSKALDELRSTLVNEFVQAGMSKERAVVMVNEGIAIQYQSAKFRQKTPWEIKRTADFLKQNKGVLAEGLEGMAKKQKAKTYSDWIKDWANKTPDRTPIIQKPVVTTPKTPKTPVSKPQPPKTPIVEGKDALISEAKELLGSGRGDVLRKSLLKSSLERAEKGDFSDLQERVDKFKEYADAQTARLQKESQQRQENIDYQAKAQLDKIGIEGIKKELKKLELSSERARKIEGEALMQRNKQRIAKSGQILEGNKRQKEVLERALELSKPTPTIEPKDPLIAETKKYKTAEEFVESKIPLYHGTTKKFDALKVGDNSYSRSLGINTVFATNNKAVASSYSGDKGDIKEIYADFKKPLIIDAKGKSWNEMIEVVQEELQVYRSALQKELSEYRDMLWDKYDNTALETDFKNTITPEEYSKVTELSRKADREAADFKNQTGKSIWKEKPIGTNYDGVIVKNVLDMAGKPSSEFTEYKPYGDVYIAFNESGFKTKAQLTDIWNKAQEAPKVDTPRAGGMQQEMPKYVKDQLDKGVTMLRREPGIRMDEAVTVKDIHGNKVELPEGHEFTPYPLSNGKIWLHDGKNVVIDKSQIAKVKQSPATTILKGFYSEPEELTKTVVKKSKVNIESLLKRRKVITEELGNRPYISGQPLRWMYKKNDVPTDVPDKYIDELEKIEEGMGMEEDDPTKFQGHLAIKGGENYQEVLVTVPITGGKKFDSSKVEIKRDIRSVTQGSTSIYYDGKLLANYGDDPKLQSDGSYKQRSEEYWTKSAKELFEKGDPRNSIDSLSGGFRTTHFPDDPNIVVHIRKSDFTTPDGKKVLQIQEIQSDWEKAGREKGFKIDKYNKYKQELLDKYGLKEDSAWLDKITDEEDARLDELSTEDEGVPFNPLLKQWKELGIKKALEMAVKGNYDYLALPTGEQTQDLYDLSKQIDTVNAEKTDKGDWKLEIIPKEKPMITEFAKENELADFIGKDLADKIIKNNGGIYSGLDLKVGGEWAIQLYDKKLPSILKKLTGAEIEQVDIGHKQISPRLAEDIEDMKATVSDYINAPFSEASVLKLRRADAPDDLIADFQEYSFPAMRKGSSTQPAIKITPTVRGKVFAYPKAGGLSVQPTKKPIKNFDNFEAKTDKIGQLTTEINKINGQRLSGQISAQDANKKIAELHKQQIAYAKEKGIAITKTPSGKTRVAIRKSGFYAKEQIATDPIRDVYSQHQSPGGMALMQDNYKKGDKFGTVYNEMWLPTKKSIADSAVLKNDLSNEVKKIAKQYKINTNSNLRGEWITDMLEGKKDIPEKFKPMIEELRKHYDSTREKSNKVRKAMNRPLIGYLKNYVSHIQKASIWNDLLSKESRVVDNLDFIIPNQARNPFAYKRLMEEMDKPERNFFKIIERYHAAVANDITITPAIENIKVYNTVLKDRGKLKSAKYWDEYIRTGLLGKQHKVDSALSVPSKGRKAIKKYKDVLNKAHLTGKIAWTVATQPLSYISLTPMEAGFRNSALAVLKMFNKGIRKSVREHSLSLKIKSKDVLSDAIGEGRGHANRIYRTKIDKVNDMLSLVASAVEQGLHQASYIAGLSKAKQLGYTGEEAHKFADLTAERTQSMYNKENRALILNSDLITGLIPFQSFAVEMSNHAKEILTKSRGAMKLGIRQRLGKLIRLLTGIWLANKFSQALTGRKKTTFGTFIPFFGETADRAILRAKNLIRTKQGKKEEYVGDRSPFSAVQQYQELIKASKSYIKYGDISKLRKLALTYAPALFGIGGGGQLSNIVDGLIANINEEVKDARGRTLFKIDDTISKIKSPIFGKWSTSGARKYWDRINKPKDKTQPKVDSRTPYVTKRTRSKNTKKTPYITNRKPYIK